MEILLSLLLLGETHGFSAADGQETTKERAAYVWSSHLGWGSGMD